MVGKNAFYAQSGGVSAVINASACGVLETARQHPQEIGKVYAGRNGIVGALSEDLIDTSLEPEGAIAALKHTPGAAPKPENPLPLNGLPPLRHRS
jgi:6-phosphofructokinase 1